MLSQNARIWNYRFFIYGNVRREFQAKYRASILGAAWSIITPLAMVTVYTLILSKIMRPNLPGSDGAFTYSIYLCAGVLTWGLFTEITNRSLVMFIENGNLLKKINFPYLCLPISIVLTALLNFFVVFSIFVGFLIAARLFPGWPLLAMIPLLAIQIMFAVGLGVMLGILNVFFRDVGQLFNVAIQFWFWMTPILYPANALPEALRPWLALNPMSGLISGYQTILVSGSWPDWTSLWPAVLTAIILCSLSLRLFRKHGGDIVDEL